MIDYSLELSLEKIYNHKSRSYFKDVLASYYCGNFRGSLVMLYSVVICDILYKLIELKEVSQIKEAEDIIIEVEKLQKNNPKSSEWEKKLIDLVNDRMDILEVSDYVNIKNLESHRHLCAHPVLTNDYTLYLPNDITTKSHIRNIYEGILINPPLRSKAIFMDMLNDLANRKDIFPTDKELERYLLSKYFKYLRKDLVKVIFKNYWKFVFRLDNEDAEKNRYINFRTLCLIYSNFKDMLKTEIENEKNYFSEIDVNVSIKYFVEFIIEYPYIYTLIEDKTKALVENKVSEDYELQLLFSTSNENLLSVIKNLRELHRINKKKIISYTFFPILNKLLDIGIQRGYVQDVINISIEFHTNSTNYDEADYTFTQLVEPIIEYYKKEDIVQLIEGIERNDQTYNRRDASNNYKKIFEYIIKNNFDIDVEKYSRFNSIIKKIRY